MTLTDAPTHIGHEPQSGLTVPQADLLYPDFTAEHDATRRMLERVPDAHLGWRPHPRSRTVGELATHIADLPNRGVAILTTDEMDVATRRPLSPVASAAELLRLHHESTTRLGAALTATAPEALSGEWTLRRGSQVLVRAPRRLLLRTMIMSHLVHHRAQLGLCLRLLELPVPGMYGPSADEMPAPNAT